MRRALLFAAVLGLPCAACGGDSPYVPIDPVPTVRRDEPAPIPSRAGTASAETGPSAAPSTGARPSSTAGEEPRTFLAEPESAAGEAAPR